MGRGRSSKIQKSTSTWKHTGCCPKCGKVFTKTNKRLVKRLLNIHVPRCRPVATLTSAEVGNIMGRQVASINTDANHVAHRDTGLFNANTRQESQHQRLSNTRQISSQDVSNIVTNMLLRVNREEAEAV